MTGWSHSGQSFILETLRAGRDMKGARSRKGSSTTDDEFLRIPRLRFSDYVHTYARSASGRVIGQRRMGDLSRLPIWETGKAFNFR